MTQRKFNVEISIFVNHIGKLEYPFLFPFPHPDFFSHFIPDRNSGGGGGLLTHLSNICPPSLQQNTSHSARRKLQSVSNGCCNNEVETWAHFVIILSLFSGGNLRYLDNRRIALLKDMQMLGVTAQRVSEYKVGRKGLESKRPQRCYACKKWSIDRCN